MAHLNKAQLIGHVGRDPEVRYSANGKAICNLSLATTYKGSNGEDTQWHRLVFFDKLAEIAVQYLKKGSLAYVEGSIKYGKFTDKDGVERNTVDIMVNSLQMLGGKDSGAAPAPAPKPKASRPPAPSPAHPGGTSFDDMADDVPW